MVLYTSNNNRAIFRCDANIILFRINGKNYQEPLIKCLNNIGKSYQYEQKSVVINLTYCPKEM